MYQSGLLVPANENSKMGWFNSILSDIGDNQSIENELSTYSYRLKRMNHFLKVANKRTLLLLDEPTAGMARHDTNATIDLLNSGKMGKMTKVIIEHDMHVVFSLADRISVLARGHIIATGTPEEIKNDPKVKEAYLGEEAVDE